MDGNQTPVVSTTGVSVCVFPTSHSLPGTRSPYPETPDCRPRTGPEPQSLHYNHDLRLPVYP